MGTRGALGFVVDGVEKIQYVHFDAYPSGLGVDVLSWAHDVADWAEVKSRARALRVVTQDEAPTSADVEQLRPWTDTDVGARGTQVTWYQLLRRTQGDPDAVLSAGCVEDASRFPLDSLFCEFAYVVDLDGDQFEAYRGFQCERHARGRFARPTVASVGAAGQSYWPVALVHAWPLAALPTDAELLAAFGYEEVEE